LHPFFLELQDNDIKYGDVAIFLRLQIKTRLALSEARSCLGIVLGRNITYYGHTIAHKSAKKTTPAAFPQTKHMDRKQKHMT